MLLLYAGQQDVQHSTTHEVIRYQISSMQALSFACHIYTRKPFIGPEKSLRCFHCVHIPLLQAVVAFDPPSDITCYIQARGRARKCNSRYYWMAPQSLEADVKKAVSMKLLKMQQ